MSSIELADISDWTIPADPGRPTRTYPQCERVPEDWIEQLRAACLSGDATGDDNDYRVEAMGLTFRVRRENTESGTHFFLRRFGEAQRLDHRRIHGGIIEQLRSEKLCRGGLVLISGATGVGKTSTAASTVITRLLAFGGVAWTIENPMEFLMEGDHGTRGGVCWQKNVRQGEFAQAMRDVMRCYPAQAQGVLFVGEIRDSETADQCIRAAANGLLVIATIHAGSVEGTVDRLVQLTTEKDRHSVRIGLSVNLRLIVHQSRSPQRPDRVHFKSLWIKENSNLTIAVRDGDIGTLRNELQFQKNRLLKKEPVT